MLVSLKEVMTEAVQKKYAAGAFNVTNLESVMAIIGAAEETKKAIILNYAEVHSPLLSMEDAAQMMLYFARKSTVPVCVHLDHGSSLEACMKAIRLGFTSVMLDASGADYEENVRETAEIVRLSHSIGITVEAELGHIFASDIGVGEEKKVAETLDDFNNTEDVYTDPDIAKDFVQKTGVDALAIAFGTAHGVYKIRPKLELERISRIREKINIPLVMHGGSGLSKEEFQTAIKNGVRKINYYTYMTLAGGQAVKAVTDKKTKEENLFFHDLPLIAVQAMKEDVLRAIRIFSMEE